MTSHYAIGRRHEENLVNLLKENGVYAERVPLSGRCHSKRADIIIPNDGNPIYVSVKYGKQVPEALWKHPSMKSGPLYCCEFPATSLEFVEVKKFPAMVNRELRECSLFFGKRPRRPWKMVFQKNPPSSVLSFLD